MGCPIGHPRVLLRFGMHNQDRMRSATRSGSSRHQLCVAVAVRQTAVRNLARVRCADRGLRILDREPERTRDGVRIVRRVPTGSDRSRVRSRHGIGNGIRTGVRSGVRFGGSPKPGTKVPPGLGSGIGVWGQVWGDPPNLAKPAIPGPSGLGKVPPGLGSGIGVWDQVWGIPPNLAKPAIPGPSGLGSGLGYHPNLAKPAIPG